MRTGVGRVTIHDVMDGINGRYTEDQFSYTGDPLDEDVWHFPARSLDKFKRARVMDELGQPVVDGTTDDAGWVYTQIAPIKDVDYGDGNNGDTIYEVYQYSIDGLVDWEDDFHDEHKYRRTAVVINGSQSAWSPAARISGKDGIQSNIINMYQVRPTGHYWSTDQLVQTDETLLILTGSFVGYDPQDGINGWMIGTPAVLGEGNALYQITATALSMAGQLEAVIPADDWSAPVQISANGVSGRPGDHGSGSYILNWNNSYNGGNGYTDLIMPIEEPLLEGHVEYWFDALANRPSQRGDILTIQVAGDTESSPKQWLRGPTEWEEFVLNVDGNAIINGTLSAEALKAKSITGDQVSATTTIITGELQPIGDMEWVSQGIGITGKNTSGYVINNFYGGVSVWSDGGHTVPKYTDGTTIEFTMRDTLGYVMVGFCSNVESVTDYVDIDYAIYMNSTGVLSERLLGAEGGGIGSYAAGDVIRIEYRGSSIHYYKNGGLLRTTSVGGDSKHYHVKVSFFDGTAAQLQGFTITGTSAASVAGINGDDSGTLTSNPYKDVRFWAGAEVPRDNVGAIQAPFHVDKAGRLTAVNADISGHINAHSGTFSGRVEAESGYFKGTVYADHIVGDLVSAKSYPLSTSGTNGWVTAHSGVINVTNNTGSVATVIIKGGTVCHSLVSALSAQFGGTITDGWRLLKNGSVVSGTTVTVTQTLGHSNGDGWRSQGSISNVLPCPDYTLTLGKGETAKFHVQRYRSQGSFNRVSESWSIVGGVSGQLFRDGGAWS